MIRIATLQTDPARMDRRLFHEVIDQLYQVRIDIVCCQGVERTLEGRQDPVRRLADALQMTYSFSATRCSGGMDEDKEAMKFRGLSILTGTALWLLNSGSFHLFAKEPERKMTAQFAVIRQDCHALLVINGDFSDNPAIHLQQLQALFSHHLLQKLYSAVVLCGNRCIDFSEEELREAVSLSRYELIDSRNNAHFSPVWDNCPQADGLLLTLQDKKTDPLAISTFGTPLALRRQMVLATEFEFNQITIGSNSRIFVPLSFSEQYA